MGVQLIKPTQDDPERHHRITERFAGPNSGDGSLGIYDWDRNGTNALNASNYAAEAGSMAIKGIRASALLDDFTRWDLFNNDIGALGVGLKFTIRIKAVDTANTYWHFGILGGTGTIARVGTVQEFLGFRMDNATDANVYGVVKDGAGGGSEDVVSLGPADAANWHTYSLTLGTNFVSFSRDGVLQGTAPLGNLLTVADFPATSMWVQNLLAGANRECRITYLDLIAPTGF